MAPANFFGIGRRPPPADAGSDPVRLDVAEARADAQQRRAEAAEAALVAVRDRLDALETELYVARSDQQRAVVRIEELETLLAAKDAGG